MDRDFVPYYGEGDILDGFVIALVWVRGTRNPWVYQVRNDTAVRERFVREMGDMPSVDFTQYLTTERGTIAQHQLHEGPRGGGCIVHDMGYDWHCKRCRASVRWCEEKGEPYTQAGKIKNGGLAGLPVPQVTEHVFEPVAVPRKAFDPELLRVALPDTTPLDEPVPPHDIVPHVGIDWARIDPATKSEVEEPISEPGHLWLPGQL